MGLKRLLNILAAIIVAFIILSCGVGLVWAAPDDPVKRYKDDFLLNYGFFITNHEPVSYYEETLGVVGKEKEIFKSLKTIEEVDKFKEVFWKIRDLDPNTSENEFKDLIDGRIEDIKNEIFMGDPDIPLTNFSHNGGLRGNLARVYLLRGAPTIKVKLPESTLHVELVVWYYIDIRGKVLFSFLFSDKGGTMRLLKRQWPILRFEDWFDPMTSPLKEISRSSSPSPNELFEIWTELESSDAEGFFRSAMVRFSDYDGDVVMEGGNNKNIVGALDPPEPVLLTAARSKPVFLGQPDDLAGREFINNSFYSFIPAEMRITDNNGRPSFTLVLGYADTDWEINGDMASSVLNLRISFQNKKTRILKEFWVSLPISKPRAEVDQKRGVVKMSLLLDDINNFAGTDESYRPTLGQLISSLDPGTYIVNIDLRQTVTKKFVGGWREEITVRQYSK